MKVAQARGVCQRVNADPRAEVKYQIGNKTYADTHINHYALINTLHGVYAALWERGVTPETCKKACEIVTKDGYSRVRTKTGIIDVKSI